jgi:hypothetical protein
LNALDLRALKETLLNQGSRDIHNEMEKWATQTHTILIEQMANSIMNDNTTTEDRATHLAILDNQIQDWVTNQKAKLQTYVINIMTNTIKEDILDPRMTKKIGTLIAKKDLYI